MPLIGNAGFGWSPGTAFAIASSTNATPIVVTTASTHGFSNGQVVRVKDHLVNTAANGARTISGVTATTFILDGSVGNGVGGATGTAAEEKRHLLEAPLRQVAPAESKVRFRQTALDRVTSEVVTVGSGVPEITGLIRYDNVALITVLSDGADGVELVYYPDLAVPTTNYPAQLIEPSGELIQLIWDRTRGPLKDYEIPIRLRRIDGGNFDGLLT